MKNNILYANVLKDLIKKYKRIRDTGNYGASDLTKENGILKEYDKVI